MHLKQNNLFHHESANFRLSSSLAHLRWKLKWAFLIVCCPSVCKLFKFIFFSRTIEPISTTFVTNILGQRIFVTSFFKWRVMPFPRGDNIEIVKIHLGKFKILFSKITGPISTKLGSRHLWLKETQFLSNQGISIL